MTEAPLQEIETCCFVFTTDVEPGFVYHAAECGAPAVYVYEEKTIRNSTTSYTYHYRCVEHQLSECVADSGTHDGTNIRLYMKLNPIEEENSNDEISHKLW